MQKKRLRPELSIGPVLFHWAPDDWRDFYFRIADEAPVETVYVGEAVCSKRSPFYEPLYSVVADRLIKAGKKVVFSSLAEVTVKPDRRAIQSICALKNAIIEVNDASALWHLCGRAHRIGQYMNVYSEDTLSFLAKKGARHFCLPAELPRATIEVLGKKAREIGVTLEVQVYGRMPLALSARCYHARMHKRTKDSCLFVCKQDPDGLDLKTLSNKPFLAINGIQTLSFTCLNLIQELKDLHGLGITSFRLSPHTHDMIAVAHIFRQAFMDEIDSKEAISYLRKLTDLPFSNGFYHKRKGFQWVEPEIDADQGHKSRNLP